METRHRQIGAERTMMRERDLSRENRMKASGIRPERVSELQNFNGKGGRGFWNADVIIS